MRFAGRPSILRQPRIDRQLTVAMSETKRMADEANRMGQQVQEGLQTGLEAASKSLSEANKGFQALASEMP
jgi:hypothetical protein